MAFKAAEKAYLEGWGKMPIPTRDGGSIPIVALFKKELGLDTLLLGLGLDSDAIHSPNESFGVFNFLKGIETIVLFHKHFSLLNKKFFLFYKWLYVTLITNLDNINNHFCINNRVKKDMKKMYVVLFALFIIHGLSAQILEPAKWSQAISEKEVQIGDEVELIFKVLIDPDWYLYSSDFDPDLGPMLTEFTFRTQFKLYLGWLDCTHKS